jgi:molybdate transport system substrate-binding protein
VKYLLAFVAASLLVLGSSPAARAQEDVTLLIPAPTKVVFDKLLPAFEAKTGFKVKVTYGTSMGTRDQVAKGDPFDVPVLRAPYPEALASGNIIPSSASTIASFVVGVGVRKGAPKPDISTPDAVKRLLLGAKAITYPDPAAGTAGLRSQEMFQKLGITDQMKSKSAIVANSGPAQAMVASGDSDLCLAYVSDMRNPGVDVVGPLPRDAAATDDLIGFVATHAKNPTAAKALLDYLSSPEAAPFYRDGGMKPGH